jgi:hypothetical protein
MTDLTGISEPARLAYAAGITPLDYAEHEIAVLLDAHATAAAFCARNGYAPVVDTSPAWCRGVSSAGSARRWLGSAGRHRDPRRGDPVSRRIGRWSYYSHPFNGPVWRLDGTTLDLEHDPSNHSVCIGGDRCNGAWVLYENGRYGEPVCEYLDGAMWQVERRWDALNATVAFLLAACGLIARRWGPEVTP